MMEQHNTKVKRIIFDSGFKPSGEPVTQIVKGLVLEEDDNFITIKTAIAVRTISKKRIIEISETNEEYKCREPA